MSKIILTVEITDGGEIIGDKENVAAALERFGEVRILKVDEPQQERIDTFWDAYTKGTPLEGKVTI